MNKNNTRTPNTRFPALSAVIFAIVTMVIFVCPPAHAQDQQFLSLSVGYFGILDHDTVGDFRAEYRSNYALLTEHLHPWAGIEATGNASLWGGGGLLYDWQFAYQFHLIPSVGAGFYNHGAGDKNLKYGVEFRSQLELAYQFNQNGERVGISLGHISNAGLGDHNPGTEIASLYWHLPY